MTVRVISDSGFDDDIETSPSFSGPDSLRMAAVEETDTEVHVRIHHVTGEEGAGRKPGEIWDADPWDAHDDGQWFDLPQAGARCLFVRKSLADLFEEGAVDRLIGDLRPRLAHDGLSLRQGRRD